MYMFHECNYLDVVVVFLLLKLVQNIKMEKQNLRKKKYLGKHLM